jgi:di/tricarboxylate transporter
LVLTTEIITILVILLIAVVLFISERLRVDLIALLILGSLAVTGMVTPTEALSGFSNPAVVTVWAVFILSGGLSRTGVANMVGRQILRLGGRNEVRLLVVIMVVAGVMSAFMNNVAVSALLLPVVINISRRTNQPPSKLLMPLAFGCLMGGMTTLIGTPSNILASDILRDYGLRPFQLFDYAPVGIIINLSGILFIALIGRHLLPARGISKEFHKPSKTKLDQVYAMEERMFCIQLPPKSRLEGKSLVQSRLGSALGLEVVGIIRDGETQLAPGADTLLRSGDRLLVTGVLDQMNKLQKWQHLVIEEDTLDISDLITGDNDILEIILSEKSRFLGKSLRQIGFRRRFNVNVLAIWKNGVPQRTRLVDIPLHRKTTFLIHGSQENLDTIRSSPNFTVISDHPAREYKLDGLLAKISFPDDSALVGTTLADSHLGSAFDLTVLNILREGSTHLTPNPTQILQVGDSLWIQGEMESLSVLSGLQELQIDQEIIPDLRELEDDKVGMVEAVISPRAKIGGKTLRELHFREKYGLNVLGIWRDSKAHRINLANMPLKMGDGLLLYGPRDRFRVLDIEPDFILLLEDGQEEFNFRKAPLAALIMLAVLLPVFMGWLPIAISAITGGALMVITGCLSMQDAYDHIKWRAVFLIAGMLPLGIAMENSGAARLIAQGVVDTIGGMGPVVMIAGVFLLTNVASQIMPNPVVIVLIAPIALNTAGDMGISPYAMMMAMAISASTSFMSPVGHPANLLVMSPGGYRFKDYIKVGLPLTLVVLVTTLLVLPFFWPLYP